MFGRDSGCRNRHVLVFVDNPDEGHKSLLLYRCWSLSHLIRYYRSYPVGKMLLNNKKTCLWQISVSKSKVSTVSGLHKNVSPRDVILWNLAGTKQCFEEAYCPFRQGRRFSSASCCHLVTRKPIELFCELIYTGIRCTDFRMLCLSAGRSVDIVRSQTKATEFSLVFSLCLSSICLPVA
jgi:hypothetical protein